MEKTPTLQKVTAALWPSFLTAGVATIITFTAFDPLEVFSCVGGPEISRVGAYSIGFFLFWLLTAVSSGLSCYFIQCKVPPRIPQKNLEEIN